MARPRHRSKTELSEFLDRVLKNAGLTHNEFAKRVGLNSSSLSDIKLREAGYGPPEAMAGDWAKVLELSPEEERELQEKLQLSFTPPFIQQLVAKLKLNTGSQAAEEIQPGYDSTG